MKGFITGFLIALYALPAFCAGGVSRVTSSAASATENSGRAMSAESGRGVASSPRASATSRAGTDVSSGTRTAGSRMVREIIPDASIQSRSVSSTRVATRATRSVDATGRGVARATRVDNTNTNSRRGNVSVRPTTAAVGGRAIMESGAQTGSNISSEIRKLQSRIAIGNKQEETKIDPAAIAEAKDRLEQTAALNKSCQEQYNDCMDQFCAVVDTNQKRCSCSANLAKYSKVEKAVKDANAQLNEVAQNIRYVGLSADEISAIMSATEAEEAMSGLTDTTENRGLLADIEKMIKDPTTTASYAATGTDSFGLIDIDMDFSSDTDLFSLDFLSGNSSSFSNLRGSDLYNAAKKRCNSVITQCKDVGATAQQITGNYDLAIDKDCIAYENGLNKMNETLVSNVRSATRMLQKARLAVLQNQNQYDARGCVSALETCMTDEMVCGENYTKCLDPTKKYIDENGNVVLGKDIKEIQNFMQNYNNAEVDATFLSDAAGTTINDRCGTDGNGKCIIKYLLGKIGTKQKATDEGLCRPVLDKCRAYTYNSSDIYMQYNDIVVNYIQRAMVNIKAAQYKIVSDYASTCLTDIATCYNDQVSQLTTWSATASVTSIYNIMRGACRNVALTCAYAVFASDTTSCPRGSQNTCINSISEIFYQSLLCPDNSIYQTRDHGIDVNNTYGGYVNARCKCKADFVSFNGQCLPLCDNGAGYLSTGVCGEPVQTCDPGEYYYKNACRACPTNSTDLAGGLQGDVIGNHCKCNVGYVPDIDKLHCQACPSSTSQYDSNAGTCVCTNQAYSYFPKHNCCGTSEGRSSRNGVCSQSIYIDDEVIVDQSSDPSAGNSGAD